MTWTRRRWLSAFTIGTLGALAVALRARRAPAARPATSEGVAYKTRWIGHF